MALNLSMSCGDYDRTQPLIRGDVKPDGIELAITCLPSPERHKRMLVDGAYRRVRICGRCLKAAELQRA